MVRVKIFKIEDDRILLEIPIVTDKNKIPKNYKELCDCVIEV